MFAAENNPFVGIWLVWPLLVLLGVAVVVARVYVSKSKAGRAEVDLVEILEMSLIAIYVVYKGRVVFVNKAMAELLGYERKEEMYGRVATDFTAIEDRELYDDMHQKRLTGELGTVNYSYRAIKKDDSQVPIMVTGGAVPYHDGLAVVGMAFDATVQREAERQARLASQVFTSAAEGIIITDAHFHIEAVNPAFTAITGYQAVESIGRVSGLLRGKHQDPEMPARINAVLAATGRWEGELIDRRKNGQLYPAWLSISTVYDEEHRVSNYVYVFTDHTRRKDAETRLQDMAARDGLTGLFNRSTFVNELNARLCQGADATHKLSVFFIDLDHFKAVNDTMGHEVGDKLLCEVATRMRSVLREQDVAARIGGDEFAVVFSGLHTCEEAASIAQRLVERLVRPVFINDQEIFVTASIGWASSPDDGTTGEELLRKADIAMYQAKSTGRNGYQPFSEDMLSQTQRRAQLENNLRRALVRDELFLVYQPQVDGATGELLAVEALLRWTTPDGSTVSPMEFIPIAEANGQIVAIGEWVVRRACEQMRDWKRSCLHIPRISINLSPKQLLREQLIPSLEQALAACDLDPSCLELEITEGAIMQCTQEVIAVMDRIRTIGIRLAIDDFGTGYSSLSVLKHLPVNKLKIDRSFVQGLPADEDDVAITEAIVAVAQKMKLEVVAEGVEQNEQRACLCNMGCSAIQGYLTGRPMQGPELERFVRSAREPVLHPEVFA